MMSGSLEASKRGEADVSSLCSFSAICSGFETAETSIDYHLNKWAEEELILNSDKKIKTYLIGDINLYKSFGNKEERRDNAGFKAYCFARKSVRSFRHDRILSITKK